MVEEQIRQLAAKHSLDGGDAFALLQLLQEQTTPILSLRSAGSSNATSSDHLPAVITDEGNRVSRIEGRRGKGRPESGRGRNVCRGVSPKKTLFTGDESDGGAARALDVNSLEEFPPMQPPATITTRKEKKAAKPRRITLTSMNRLTPHQNQTPSSHPPHFTPLLPPASESWSSHPAFVDQVTTTSTPSPMSEERKLLRKERSRQTQRRVDGSRAERRPKNTPSSSSVGITPSRSTTTNSTDRTPVTHPKFPTGTAPQESPLTSSSAGTVLTSTPAPSGFPDVSVVSVERVTNSATLDHLAQLHSKIITDRLVPNITSEIHFVIQLLTCTQPNHPPQNISEESEHLFHTVENCVYFSIRVLYEIRNFLTALDTASLQLLSENARIKQFEPKLTTFLSGALERAQTEVNSRGQRYLLPQTAFTNRVPFQEETDNLKNFPNMKVFHAFKKQRDNFYTILREWEANHNLPHWNFQSALRDKIRTLMSQPPEVSSLDHLATLFQRQLMESCSYAAHLSAGMDRLVEGPLKNLNPDKLMKLSERFLRQSHTGTGTSPPVTFSESEQFFSSFITTADSYTFNCHLTSTLHHELLRLHSRCEMVAAREVPEVLHALRVLAKFLGYLDFFPYTSSVSLSLLQARTASPHVLMVSECVSDAVEKGHLSLTIPWAVDYLSMMDSHALQVPQIHSLLCQMVTIYRSTLLEGNDITADSFLVLTCLGWLLETPNVPSSVFFQCLKNDGSQPSKQLPQSELVTRDLLYICCPYLACVRVTLAEFASGLQSKTSPIRKIKPIPAGPGTSHAQSSPASQLQMKLQESFFRNHPPLLKQLCDTVSERVSETAVQLVQSQIVPEHVRSGLQTLAVWIGQSCSDQANDGCSVDLEQLFHRNEAVVKVAQVSEQTFSCVQKKTTEFCRQHSEDNTCKAINALVCGTIPKQVVEVAVGISANWAMERCMKWVDLKLRGVVFEEVRVGFEKLRKAVRTGVKASQSHHSASDNLHNSSVSSPNPTSRSSQLHNSSASSLDTSSHHLPSPSSGNCCGATVSSNSSTTPLISSQQLPTGKTSHLLSTDRKETSKGALCPMSQFMELVTSAMATKHNSPPKEAVLEVVAATESVREFLLEQVVVVEGGHSPCLLPQGTDHLLSTSVQFAVLLVAHGLMESISANFTSLWSLLKGLKQEIPVHLLLSTDSFSLYQQQVEKGVEKVWSSLAVLLEEIIELGIAATDVVEALWLCQIRLSSTSERQSVISGSAVFLAKWFGYKAQQKDGVAAEDHGMFREVCFVRLLKVVTSESDSALVDCTRHHPSLPFLSL